MHKKLIISGLLFLLFIPGCSQYPAPTSISPSTISITAYPEPVLSADPLAYPGSDYILPPNSEDAPQLLDTLIIPQPSEGTANVYGQFTATDGAGYAYLAGDIYLAPVIYSEGEIQVPFVSLDINNDPKASQRTKDHQFLFVDVPPGIYGIVIHTPVSDFVVLDDVDGFRYVEITEGNMIDLGVIPIE